MNNRLDSRVRKTLLENQLTQLDQFIKNGNHDECRRLLNHYNPKKIPRRIAVNIAELAIRINDPTYALKVLEDILFPERSFLIPATNKEKILYSKALATLGAIKAALDILKNINPNEEPEALFHRATNYLYHWDYITALPLLQQYCSLDNITPYRRLVGKVNLAAIYINTKKWDLAHEFLTGIKLECEQNNYSLLLGNTFELMAQIDIYQGHYDQATPKLEKAYNLLKDQGGFYTLYVEKWMTLCRCLKFKNSPEIEQLRHVRAKAQALGHWNTIRECDLFEAILTENEALIKKIIMGTPSEYYRQRARHYFGKNIIFLGQYKLHLYPIVNNQFLKNSPLDFKTQSSADKNSLNNLTDIPIFDPYLSSSYQKSLYRKPMLLALYGALTIDFYQPQTLGTIFELIYPHEKYNPFTSPHRILQLLRRLNKWFTDHNCPLRINFNKNEFKLITTQEIQIVIYRSKKVSSTTQILYELKQSFKDNAFSINDAIEVLKISKSAAERLLKKAYQEKKISKDRNKFGVIYRLAKRKNNSKEKVA